MSNNKMKGLLKGLRYISQIFDNDKEQEMQIGYPTDVKHVAHIGWDGPSVNQPSWMNEFKPPPGFSSAPLSLNRDLNDDNSVKWASEDSSRIGTQTRMPNSPSRAPGSPPREPDSPARGSTGLPKSSRRRSSTGASGESPTREKSDIPKQSRRSSKNATKDLLDGTKPTRNYKDPSQGSESPSNLPEMPKKTRTKKSKDGSTTSRSRTKANASEADGSYTSESVSKSKNNEHCCASALTTLVEEDGEKGFTGIS